MVLCKPKPLHNIYYVSIVQCLPWGWAYGRWSPGGMKSGCSTNNPNRRNRHLDNLIYLYRRICFLLNLNCKQIINIILYMLTPLPKCGRIGSGGKGGVLKTKNSHIVIHSNTIYL